MKNIFEIKAWDETPYLELDGGAKHTRATIKKQYQGVFVGDGHLEYIMVYHSQSSASFVGMEYFNGHVDGRQGSVTLEHKGIFKDGIVESEFNVIKGSCSDALIGLTAKGNYSTGHSMAVEFELIFSINKLTL